jgi:hypothetical protein
MGGVGSGKPPNHSLRRKILRLRKQGLNQTAIARQLGVSPQNVSVILSRMGRSATQAGIRRRCTGVPGLTIPQILRWARSYFKRHRRYPSAGSGPIEGTEGETWEKVAAALRDGCRGLPGGSSLPRLMRETFRARPHANKPDLSVEQILRWADAHHCATGRWPTVRSGPVQDVPGESWQNIDRSLEQGRRGLPGGTTLARLLNETGRGPARVRVAWTAEEDALLGLRDSESVRKGVRPRAQPCDFSPFFQRFALPRVRGQTPFRTETQPRNVHLRPQRFLTGRVGSSPSGGQSS